MTTMSDQHQQYDYSNVWLTHFKNERMRWALPSSVCAGLIAYADAWADFPPWVCGLIMAGLVWGMTLADALSIQKP